MGGDHHHGPLYKVPDYKIYKVENAPQLVELQTALAAKGLKDPWIRNEVWRYNEKEFSTHSVRARNFFLRGFKWGVLALIGTIALEKAYDAINPPTDHHHGHH